MTDSSKPDRWGQIAAIVGAQAPPDAPSTKSETSLKSADSAGDARPDDSPIAAQPASKPKPTAAPKPAKATDWSRVAENLGLDPAIAREERTRPAAMADEGGSRRPAASQETLSLPTIGEEVVLAELVSPHDTPGDAPGDAPRAAEGEAKRRRRRRRGRRSSGEGRGADRPKETGTTGRGSAEKTIDEDEIASSGRDAADEGYDAERRRETSEGESAPDGTVVDGETRSGDKSRPRRRRRRRRSSRGEDATASPASAESDGPRQRTPDVRNKSTGGKPASMDAAAAKAADDDDDDQDDLGAPDEEQDESEAKVNHRNIPTWTETVGYVVSANMESRTKNPQRTGSSAPPRSKGRGRGRGRNPGGKKS